MRIAVFADCRHREDPGIADLLLRSGQALARRGHAVLVAMARGEASDRPDLVPTLPELGHDLTIIRLPSLPSRAGWRWPVIPTGLTALRCRAWAPDIVHGHEPFGAGVEALAAARLLRVPLISTRRGPIGRDGPLPQVSPASVALRYVRWYYRQCDMVTSPSEAVATTLRECGLGVTIRTVSDSLNVDPWPAPERAVSARPGRSPGAFALLHVGRLSAEQRVDEIIRAIPSLITRIPAVSLTLVGSGPAESALRTLADHLQVTSHVRFAGELGRPRLRDTYAASDVFVSMSTAEAARLTLIDAMATGLPTIGARTPALSACVDGSRGMSVEATDTAALVAAILALHRDPARAATLGASGRAYAARFAPEPIAAEWEEIYGEVLLRARPRRASESRPLPQPTARRS